MPKTPKGANTVANTNEKNEKKIPKQLVLRDAEGQQYTLQFNRKVVMQMQRNGFVLDLDRLLMSATDLIQGAFRMHHPWLKWEQIEAIWKFQPKSKRGELLGYLAQMFSAPALDLMGDGTDEDEAEPENPTFEIVF